MLYPLPLHSLSRFPLSKQLEVLVLDKTHTPCRSWDTDQGFAWQRGSKRLLYIGFHFVFFHSPAHPSVHPWATSNLVQHLFDEWKRGIQVVSQQTHRETMISMISGLGYGAWRCSPIWLVEEVVWQQVLSSRLAFRLDVLLSLSGQYIIEISWFSVNIKGDETTTCVG